jgi:glycosyltransferase involved in cell wall biosynthesis
MLPSLSIVIPVWNDAEAIQSCLARLRTDDAPPAEVIVCDATTEQAAQALTESAAARHRARYLRAPQPSRGAQIAAGVAAATGDLLVFSHADTQLAAAHLHSLRAAFHHHPHLLAGAFQRDVASLYPALAWATPAIHWYMAELGFLYGDQSPFIRHTTLAHLGGYPALPLMEDLTFSNLLRHHLSRHEITLLTPSLPTSPRRFLHHGYLTTKLKNLALTTAWQLGLASPHQLHQYYYTKSPNSDL